VPSSVLTWHEEESRFAFQNGESVFMRNWPYPYAQMNDSSASRVAGRYAIAPMPAAPGGRPTAALGGANLAINANSDHPEAAWAVIDYLTQPQQMIERARVVGQFPTRPALYDEPALAQALAEPVAQARLVIEHAVPRPVTPVYTQLSDILQIDLHRALTRQLEPAAALAHAAREMQALLVRVGLGEGGNVVGR
jgi:multiple sugar transport system substrate-binding protein